VSEVAPTIIVLLLEEYNQSAAKRHEMGSRKYGENTFLTIDTIQHAIDEVLDLGNYAKYTYVKLRLLQMGLLENVHADGSVAVGKPAPDDKSWIEMEGT
jgi:hypothetical protein